MAITGAIFDCDGTILDSMKMWRSVCVDFLARYGVFNQEEFLEEAESMNLDEECELIHTKFGIGTSGEALFHELNDMIDEQYTHHVQAFAGIETLLKELDAADIPCVIATASNTTAVWHGLQANHLDSYFQRVFCTYDIGRGKEFPDIYNAALAFLDTDRASTWVFEDAPFGLKTSQKAGFPTVGIMNDKNKYDHNEVASASDVLIRSYGELNLSMLENYEN